MRKASLADVPLLVTMMAEFYAPSPYTLNSRRATEAFTTLLSDERLGHVWLIQANSQNVGYVVVTLCHGMTYGGLSAIVDDFYIRPAFRGVGLGKAAMAHVRSYCISHGIRAILVETDRDNATALAVYRHAGFVDTDLVHLTLALADPTHAPGYSGTPLAKKLGIAEGVRVLLRHAPEDYLRLVEPLPPRVVFDKKLSEATDLVHVFSTSKAKLAKELSALRKGLRNNAFLWVSWPKKASKVPTDITENTVRDLALPLGFVDVKVCAVSEVWSGLKLVIRKDQR